MTPSHKSELPAGVGDDELVLVWQAIEIPAAERERLHATLTDAERAAAARYHFEKDRQQSVVSRGTLRALLGRFTGRDPASLELSLGAHGKPALVSGELELNVSHSGQWLLFGFSRGRALGVDVEGGHRTLDVDELAPTVFTAVEREALRAYSGDARRAAFLRAWTRKEAYLKARAVGLSLPLQDFSVSLDLAPATLRSDVDPVEAARFELVGLDAPAGYEAAVAWEKHDRPLRQLLIARGPSPR